MPKHRRERANNAFTLTIEMQRAPLQAPAKQRRVYEADGNWIEATLIRSPPTVETNARGESYTVNNEPLYHWRDGARAGNHESQKKGREVAGWALAQAEFDNIAFSPLPNAPGFADVAAAIPGVGMVHVEVTTATDELDRARNRTLHQIECEVLRRIADEDVMPRGRIEFMFWDAPGQHEFDGVVEAIVEWIRRAEPWPTPGNPVEAVDPRLTPFCRAAFSVRDEPITFVNDANGIAYEPAADLARQMVAEKLKRQYCGDRVWLVVVAAVPMMAGRAPAELFGENLHIAQFERVYVGDGQFLLMLRSSDEPSGQPTDAHASADRE